MNSIPYVQIEYGEAIDARRELLSSQAASLEALKRIQNYKELRKRELLNKNKLKISINNLNKKIKNIVIDLPDIKEQETPSQLETEEIIKKKTINQELKEIQEKLAELEKE